MRAIVVDASGQSARCVQVADPELGRGTVRVGVRAVVLHRRDVTGLGDSGFSHAAQVPGTQFAGDVLEVGEQVTNLVPGDRVVGFVRRGACAEQVVTSAASVHRIHDDIGYAHGALSVFCGLRASHAVSALVEHQASSALVLGASGPTSCLFGGLARMSDIDVAGISFAEVPEAALAGCGFEPALTGTTIRSTHDMYRAMLELSVDSIVDCARDPLPEEVLRGVRLVVHFDPSDATPGPERAAWSGQYVAIDVLRSASHDFGDTVDRVGDVAHALTTGRISVPTMIVGFDDIDVATTMLVDRTLVGAVILEPS